MASVAPLASSPEPHPQVRTETAAATPAAPIKQPEPESEAETQRNAEAKAQRVAAHIPGELRVEIDAEAGRFVQTLVDGQTKEMVWRYPSETQLAYSRAVTAYLRASAQV